MSIDSGTKRRLALGFLSNWIAKLSYSAIQLIQVPFLLYFWSIPLNADWAIVTAIPSYLGFSNIGFGSVAGNEMTMLVARDDRDGALRVFQSCWWFIVMILVVVGGVAGWLLYALPVAELLHLHALSNSDAKWIVAYLGIAILFGQLEQLLQSAYRCVGRYPYGSFVKSCMTLFAFTAMLVPVGLHAGPRVAALVFAAANIAGTFVFMFMVRRDIPWLRFGWSHATTAEIVKLAPPAIAFMGFPLGNALNLDGSLIAVNYALNPLAVVIFKNARTVSRIALQMVQMVNSTFEPEFSKSFGQNDIPLVRTLHRRACQAALLLSAIVVLAMMTLGPWFLNHWTDGKVPPSRTLLTILLAVVVLYSLWSTSSTVMTATNRHQRLAAVYLGATAVTVATTYFAAQHFGLYGAAASLFLAEILMNLYVLPASLRLAHDTLPAFLGSLLQYPPTLRPQAILRRLRRSKPALES